MPCEGGDLEGVEAAIARRNRIDPACAIVGEILRRTIRRGVAKAAMLRPVVS